MSETPLKRKNERKSIENHAETSKKKAKLDYLDEEAEETSSNASSDEAIGKKKSKLVKKRRTEEEEEDEESDGFIDSSEEEENEEDNEYQKDGFLVDDLEMSSEEEEAEEDQEEVMIKKKKKKKEKTRRRLKQKKEDEIDDEDLALLRENLGYEAPATYEDEEEDEDEEEEVEERRKKKHQQKTKKDLGKEIFGDSEDEEDEDEEKETSKQGDTSKKLLDYAEDMDYESDDLDEFIVDDDPNAIPRSAQRHKRSTEDRVVEGPSVYQMDEAEELFGDLDDLMNATHGIEKEKEMPKKKVLSRQEKLLQAYEPSLLKEHMLTEEYEEIKKADMPERFYLDYGASLLAQLPDSIERQEEGEWIGKALYNDILAYREFKQNERAKVSPTKLSIALAYPRQMTMGNVIAAVIDILRLIQEEKMEIPYIKQYCKEIYKSAGLGRKHLYAIYEMDLTWRKMMRRKRLAQRLLSFLRQSQENSIATGAADPYEFYHWLLSEGSDPAWILKEEYLRDLVEFLKSMISDVVLRQSTNLRPRKKDTFYRLCQNSNLRALLHSFTLPMPMIAKRLYTILENRRKNPTAATNAESLEDELEIPTPDSLPLDIAKNYIARTLPNANDVLRAVEYMAAFEFSMEPNIRQYLKQLYTENVVINTTASIQGKKVIDEFHYAHGLQYMVSVSARELLADFRLLRMDRAEKDGLLTSEWYIPKDKMFTFYSLFETIYLNRAAGDPIKTAWEEKRKSILYLAIEKILFTKFKQEVKTDLLRLNRETLVTQCGDRLQERLMIRPYDPLGTNDYYSTVTSFYVTHGRYPELYIVILDPFGNMVDKVKFHTPSNETIDFIRSIRNKPLDRFRDGVIEFITPYASRIDVIVFNTNSGENSLRIKPFLESLKLRLFNDRQSKIPLLYLNDDFARIYSKSLRGEKEFPNDSLPIRCAVSLGRYLQNPVAEYGGLWGQIPYDLLYTRQNDILYLSLHPYQHFVSRPALLREYMNRFLYVVNHVGVDINLAAQYTHHSYVVQFISGLGPTKASFLLQELKRKTDKINRRQDLQTIIGKIIYRNAAGFLRIRDHEQDNHQGLRKSFRSKDTDEDINPLVDTRVHPESYYMAVKMCGDANETTLDMYNPRQFTLAIEDVMLNSMARIQDYYEQHRNLSKEYVTMYRNRLTTDMNLQDRLSELDIASYSHRLEQEGRGPKLSTLDFIKRELRYPYYDKRKLYIEPSGFELFLLTINETSQSFTRWMFLPIELSMIREGSERIYVKLSSHPEVRGFLYKENLPAYMSADYLQSYGIPRGCTLYGRIVEFVPDQYLEGNFILRLACDEKSICDTAWVNLNEIHTNDPKITYENMGKDSIERNRKHINQNPMEAMEKHQMAAAQAPTHKHAGRHHGRRTKRQIIHPAFRNYNLSQTLQYLKAKPIGECLFRPSSRGVMNLTLSWKMLNNIYRHYDLQEEKKTSGGYAEKEDLVSNARLGEKLIYKDEKYDSIDEVIGRLIQPMNELVEEVVAHKYYRVVISSNTTDTPINPYEAINKELYEAKKKTPNTIPYLIHVSLEKQVFCVSYLPRITVRHAYFDVLAKGFRFIGNMESAIIPTFKHALLFFKKKALDIRKHQMPNGPMPPPSARYREERPAWQPGYVDERMHMDRRPMVDERGPPPQRFNNNRPFDEFGREHDTRRGFPPESQHHGPPPPPPMRGNDMPYRPNQGWR